MKRLLLLSSQKLSAIYLMVLLVASQFAFAQPTVLGTQLVNGTYSTSNLNTVGGFKQVRLQATTAAASGARSWEFAKGTAAATDYSNVWRPYTGGNVLSVNTFIPTSFDNGAKFNNGGGVSGLLPAIIANSYYTFNVSNLAGVDNVMSLLETTYNPITIASTTRFNNTINIVTSGTPDAAENIYVRYTTNSFATSTLVQATGSGTSWSATIPATGSVTYYIYTSNRSKAAIESDVSTYGQGVHDMSTLSLLNNAQANYTYTATDFIAYNEINSTGLLPSPYTDGQVVANNASASGIARSAGLTGTSAGNRYTASGWPLSFTATRYFEFTITPNSGFNLNFTNLAYTFQASGTGAQTASLRSSRDNFAADIAVTTGGISTTGTSGTFSLGAGTFQGVSTAITFRIYGYGATNSSTGTFSVNDYSFNGTITAASPNPVLSISGTTAHGTVCPMVSATPITYTITNSGPVAASGVAVVSNDPQFAVSALSATTIAANGGTASYVVTFAPASSGAKTATVTVTSTTTGSNIATSSLTGTGATPVTAAVTTTAATVVTSTTATLNGNVTALGTCPSSTNKGFVYSLTSANAAPTFGGTGVTSTSVAASTGSFNVALTGLTASTSYSFRAYITDGNAYTYGSVLTFTTTTPPINDECSGAIALILDSAPLTGDVMNATQSLAATPCVGNANDDVWYKFTTTVAGEYTIKVVGSASFNAVVNVRTGACPSTVQYACANFTGVGGVETLTSPTVPASTTYYIRVYDFGSGYPGTTTFTIEVSSPPPALSTNGTSSIAFTSTPVLTTSASETVNISASYLDGAPGNITATAPLNFQVSADNINFGTTAMIPFTSPTLASTPVYVRFAPETAGAKTGNLTFSGGGLITSPTVALNGSGTLEAPVATIATNINSTSFDANWNAVTSATGYLLDVSTSPTFGTAGTSSVTESFETGLTGSYQTGNVTLSTGVWAVTNVLKGNTGVNSGTGSAQMQSVTGSALVSPTLTDVTTVSFWVTSSTATGAIQFNYSTDGGSTWIAATGSPFTGLGTTKVQKTVTLNVAGNIKIQILRTAATMYIDDIIINDNADVPDFVTGYNSLSVGNVTTYTVTGLMPFTNYYYRVRATDGTVTSANSNTQTATTGPETVIWNGTAWSNTVGPDLTKRASIQGIYNTGTNGAFQAFDLTISSGSLTVATGTNLVIQKEITNTLTADAFVIENDANVRQIDSNPNSAAAKVYRNSASIMRLDYTLWSSPVTGQQLQAFSPGTLANRFYTYNPATDLYAVVDPTTDFVLGRSNLIRVENTHPTTPTPYSGVFTGALHNGTVDLIVSPDTFNAFGNPFPSTISADSFINVNGIVEPLYFWRKTNNAATTSYATYTLAGGTGTSSNSGDPANMVPNGSINVGQGFIAKATSAAVTFTNLMRTTNNEGQFFRANDVERNRIWLKLTNDSGLYSQTMVSYMTGATMGVDNAIDGKYFNDSQNALTTIIDSNEYAIQGRALPFNDADVVPMGFKVTAAGNYTIALEQFDGLFTDANVGVFLRDNLTGAVSDLRAGAYTFASEVGVFNTRFEIVYQALLKTQVTTLEANSIVVYKSNGSFVINSGINTMSEVAVYDVQGRLLLSKKQINATQTTLQAMNTNQVLLMQITMDNGAKATKKVVN